MSELFNTLLNELGDRIAQNSQYINENQKEISFLIDEPSSVKNSTRISELIGLNKRLQVESREFFVLQLKLRSFLRNQNKSTLLQIEETSGYWIDELTERFILSNSNDVYKPENVNSAESRAQVNGNTYKTHNGMIFDFNDFKLNNLNMPENLIEQYAQSEKYEICSILINVFSSRN